MKRTLFDQVAEPGIITVEFQPILNVGNGDTSLYAFEALARGPAGTSLARPDVLFEYARRKGEESRLDLVVIREVFAAARTLMCEPCISINIHGSTLSNIENFAEKFITSAQAHGIDPRRLMLEIVEHRAPWTMETFRQALNQLRDAGVRIAVDDLGIGASNFRMFVDCRPDHLKVDRYIVNGSSSDPYRAAVLESIVTLAKACNGAPIAEGIETADDLALVTQLGIHLVQGWYYAPSMPAHLAADWAFRQPDRIAMKGFNR